MHPVKSEIKQVDLNVETAARSSKLFYYLTQSLAKWNRGLELLRFLLEETRAECVRVRGDSDHHFSAREPLEEAH